MTEEKHKQVFISVIKWSRQELERTICTCNPPAWNPLQTQLGSSPHREPDSVAQIPRRNLHSSPLRTGTDNKDSYFTFEPLPNEAAPTGKNMRQRLRGSSGQNSAQESRGPS